LTYEPNAKGQYADGMMIKGNALTLTGYRLPREADMGIRLPCWHEGMVWLRPAKNTFG
jgi:hypothetical protein